MARVHLIEKDEVTDKVVLRTYESIEKQQGRVTNLFKALAHRPEVLRTIGPLIGAIMGTGELDHKLKEKIALKVSMLNNCAYCIEAHRRVGRKLGMTDEEFAQLEDIEEGDFTPAERVALRYAEQFTISPGQIPEELFNELRENYTESQIVEITCVAGLFNFLNRFNTALDVEFA